MLALAVITVVGCPKPKPHGVWTNVIDMSSALRAPVAAPSSTTTALLARNQCIKVSKQVAQYTDVGVGWFLDSIGYAHGFYNDGTWHTVDVPGAFTTALFGLDQYWNMVGFFNYSSGSPFYGLFYNPVDNSFVQIDAAADIYGAESTYFMDISADNVSGFYYDTEGLEHGLIYQISTGICSALDMPSKKATELRGINPDYIVGNYANYANYNDPKVHGCLYNRNTGLWTTVDVPDTYNTWPTRVNGSNIIGYYGSLDEYYYRGFIHSIVTGNWTKLDIPGAGDVLPQYINNGYVIGYYADLSGNTYGFVFPLPPGFS